MDPEVDCILVAHDQNFNYTKLCLASLYIQNGKAKFICTNEEPYQVLGEGLKFPGTGSIVEAIQIALNNEEGSQERRRPEVVGAPNSFAVEFLQKQDGLPKEKIVVITTEEGIDTEMAKNAEVDCVILDNQGQVKKTFEKGL